MKTGGWKVTLVALAAFVVLPFLPTALQLLIPIQQTVTMLVTLLAVYAAVGWWQGGNGVVAAIWLLLAAWMLLFPASHSAGDVYGALVRGWLLLLGGTAGITLLVTPEQGFFSRALSALGIATVIALALAVTVPGGIGNVRDLVATEYTRRADHIIAGFETYAKSPEGREIAQRFPSWNKMANEGETQLRALPERSATLMPAILALESLAALALAWAVYHLVGATPLGPALGRWREFRFNDQLIWGLAVGAVIAFLPAFAEGKSAGFNVLLFFGALYLLRGVGVLSWVSRGRWMAAVLVILTAIAPMLIAAMAFGIGVGDTWMDWRRRIPAAM